MRTLALLTLVAALAGCAHRPPPVHSFKVGAEPVGFHDYSVSAAGACEGQPAWLAEELRVLNDQVAYALIAFERSNKGEAPLQTLADLQRDHLSRFERSLKVVLACPEGFRARLGGQPERSADLLATVKQTLSEAQAALEAKQAAKAWAEAIRARRQSAKEQWCAGDAVASAEVYYAVEDHGRVRYYFCNGAEVEQGEDGNRVVTAEPPVAASRRRKGAARPKYTEIVERFPADDIDRTPAPEARLTTDATVR